MSAAGLLLHLAFFICSHKTRRVGKEPALGRMSAERRCGRRPVLFPTGSKREHVGPLPFPCRLQTPTLLL